MIGTIRAYVNSLTIVWLQYDAVMPQEALHAW